MEKEENKDFLTTQIITYLGNKRSLIGKIEKEVEEIENIKNKRVLEDVKNSIKTDNLEEYVKAVKNNSSADITSEEIAAGLLKKIREN